MGRYQLSIVWNFVFFAIDEKEDVLSYWRSNQSRFPELALLVRKYLSAPASSVPSEQLFSKAGLVYDPQRSRLDPTRAEKLLFIKANLPLFDFMY